MSVQSHSSLHHIAQRNWSEPNLHPSQFIFPLFVSDKSQDIDIAGFSPNKQWGCQNDYANLVAYLSTLIPKGLSSVMLFGVVAKKDSTGSSAEDAANPVIACVKVLAKALPTLMIACDICLCEYTDHGHCGVLHTEDATMIDNRNTLLRLEKIAVAYAKAGAHMVCPSDMMDNRIGAIRKALNDNSYFHVSIMSYTSKKASCLYAPFRLAVDSTFTGHRQRYQHPIGATHIANRLYERDVAQGSDSVIVKPSLFYTDIVQTFAKLKKVPVVAYVVSGEYKMLMDYGQSTGMQYEIMRESHLSLLRAGASVIITYATPYLLDAISSKNAVIS